MNSIYKKHERIADRAGPGRGNDKRGFNNYYWDMRKKALAAKLIVVGGTGSTAALLFWMAIYMVGPLVLVANVIALAIGIAWLTRKIEDGWALVERTLVACIVAGQAGLIVAMLIRVAPVVAKHAL